MTFLNFGNWLIVSLKEYKTETQSPWKTTVKSYVIYLVAPTSVTLIDLKGHFCCQKPF